MKNHDIEFSTSFKDGEIAHPIAFRVADGAYRLQSCDV